jgi:hypothetical protein
MRKASSEHVQPNQLRMRQRHFPPGLDIVPPVAGAGSLNAQPACFQSITKRLHA